MRDARPQPRRPSRRWPRVVLLIAALAAASAGAAQVLTRPLPAREQAAWEFVDRRMLAADGAMVTMVPLGGCRAAWAGPKMRGVLAESTGLLMAYAVLADRPELLRTELALIDRRLSGPYGLVCWRASAGARRPLPSSASIDDLTIARALIEGGRAWDDAELVGRGRQLGRAVLRYQLDGDVLVDAASWNDEALFTSRQVQLSYLDLRAMQLLEAWQPGWAAVRAWAAGALSEHALDSGLFPEVLDLDTGKVRPGDGMVNGIHSLYCALHLAEVGAGGGPTLAFFVAELERDGRLAGRYGWPDGAPVDGFEGVAVYALAARLALALGDVEAAERFVERMLDYQRTGDPRRDRGAFSCADTAHSFDNLQALIALRSLRRAR